MKVFLLSVLLISQFFVSCFAQERVVQIDFESGSFINNPKIPFDKQFGIIGETGKDIEFVKVNIFYQDKDYVLHSFVWNRIEKNKSETFDIVVPPILKSNTKYDFEITTYKLLSADEKVDLIQNVEDRIRFLLENNIYFDGKNVVINKPKDVYEKIDDLIERAFEYNESKNLIPVRSPSDLVLSELSKQSEFKFKKLFKKTTRVEKNEASQKLINERINHLVDLIISELEPFMKSQVVQRHRKVKIAAVETDKERFSLPVNAGMYAWSKSTDINNTSVQNIDFTPGFGVTIPFSNKSKLISKTRLFDSFGASAGLLLEPVSDANDTKFITPGINLPLYMGLGFRMFKVIRVNAGALILGEKGTPSFNKLTILPTIGLALELNLWMGIKK